MKRKILPPMLLLTAFLLACAGTGGSSDIAVKFEGTDTGFPPSSTWAYHSTKTFSFPENGKTVLTKSSTTTVVLANYELDTKQAFISLGKQKIDKPEHLKVMFSFTGKKGSSVDSAIDSGDYAADADKYQKVDGVTIYHFADGKEKRTSLSNTKMTGKVSVDSVSGGTISGSIDVTDGTNSVKGSFSAKGHESVK